MHKGIVDVDLASGIDLLLLVLIEHDVAYVFDVVEVLFFEVQDNWRDVLLFYPNEKQAIFHDISRDCERVAEFFDCNKARIV